MRLREFIVRAATPQRMIDAGGYVPPDFICPKCGGNDVVKIHMGQLDRLWVVCKGCGYAASREPLDAPGGEEEIDVDTT